LQFREPCALTCSFVFDATVVIFFAVLSAKSTDAQYPGCWYVLSPTYFPMCFVWWWEYFVLC